MAQIEPLDDAEPIGPNECPECPGAYHWPAECYNRPELRRERRAALRRFIKAAKRQSK